MDSFFLLDNVEMWIGERKGKKRGGAYKHSSRFPITESLENEPG